MKHFPWGPWKADVPVTKPAEVCSRWASASAKPCVTASALPCSQNRSRLVSHSIYTLQALNLKPVGNTNSRKGIVQTQPGFLWDGPCFSLLSFCLSLALFQKCPCQAEMQKMWKFWAKLFSMTSTNYWSERKMSSDDTEHWAGEKGESRWFSWKENFPLSFSRWLHVLQLQVCYSCIGAGKAHGQHCRALQGKNSRGVAGWLTLSSGFFPFRS